jgi:hypothetical protein
MAARFVQSGVGQMWRIEERPERLHIPLGFLSMREVAHARKASQRGPGDEGRGLDSVGDRDQGVAIAPEDRDGRQRPRLVCAVEKVPALAPSVDDIAHTTRKGTCGAGACVELREDRDLLFGERAPSRIERPCRAERHEWLTEAFDEEGKRRPPKRRADLAAKTAGRFETEPPDALAMPEKHPLCDASAERMPDEVHLVEVELLQPRANNIRVPVERVARVGARRLTVASKIEHEDPARARESRSHGEPGSVRVTEPVQENERVARSQFGPVKIDLSDTGETMGSSDGGGCRKARRVSHVWCMGLESGRARRPTEAQGHC